MHAAASKFRPVGGSARALNTSSAADRSSRPSTAQMSSQWASLVSQAAALGRQQQQGKAGGAQQQQPGSWARFRSTEDRSHHHDCSVGRSMESPTTTFEGTRGGQGGNGGPSSTGVLRGVDNGHVVNSHLPQAQTPLPAAASRPPDSPSPSVPLSAACYPLLNANSSDLRFQPIDEGAG